MTDAPKHILVQAGAKDFMHDGERIFAWMEDIADHSGGEFTADALLDQVNNGTIMVFYYAERESQKPVGLICTMRAQFDHGATLAILGAAGDAQGDWAGLTFLFNDLAKALQCTSFEIKGRRGFMKTMKPFGWQEKYTVISHEVIADDNVVPLKEAEQ
jgi:hypothetical protein